MDPSKFGVELHSGEYRVVKKSRFSNHEIWRIIKNGYPNKMPGNCINEVEAYTATMYAIKHILLKYDFSKYTVDPGDEVRSKNI